MRLKRPVVVVLGRVSEVITSPCVVQVVHSFVARLLIFTVRLSPDIKRVTQLI